MTATFVSHAARVGIPRPDPYERDRRTTMSDHEHPKTARRIACHDLVPGCGFTATAETEEELMKQVAAHAQHAHGIAKVTPELAAKVKAAITEQ